MWWWLSLAVYLVGYIVAFRRIVGQIAWHLMANPSYSWDRGRTFPKGGQWASGIAAAVFLALVWPVSLLIAHAIAGARSGAGVFYIPPSQREQIMAARIAELEKKAGIR